MVFSVLAYQSYLRRSIVAARSPVEGTNVTTGPKCNKILNVTTLGPNVTKVLNVTTIGPKCNN